MNHIESRARRKLIAEKVREGSTVPKAASLFEVTESTVYAACREFDIEPNYLIRKRKRKKIADLIEGGISSFKELRNHVVADSRMVRRACSEHGVIVPRGFYGNVGNTSKSLVTSFKVLIALSNENKSFRQIAALCGVSFQRVSQIYRDARKAGIPNLPRRKSNFRPKV